MSIAFISDIHLSAQRPATTQLFEEFLAENERLLERLYILGDLFDYWVGDDSVGLLGHDAVEAALRNTVTAGTQVFFMHGNRDFLVGEEFARRTGCQLLSDPAVVSYEHRNLLLTHGDALCTDDIEHQNSRRQMLSAKWKTAFLQQPLAERIHTAAAMRAQSKAAKRTKSRSVMDVNPHAVENLMRQHGVDTMIHGHTHQPAVHAFEIAQKPAWRYVLGDWPKRRNALYLQQGELVLKNLAGAGD